MDKWVRKLKSVEVIDSIEDFRIIKYTNSTGDKIESFNKQVRITISGKTTTLSLGDIKSVEMNPMFKHALAEPYIIIKTEEEDMKLLIDTQTEQFHDLPTVYDYIRRLVSVG